MLRHELDEEDFGLRERLALASNDSKRRLLGSKVLNLLKRISVDAPLAIRLTMSARLFVVLEKLIAAKDDFAGTVYSLLLYFLVEWHENKVLRAHLLSNFTDLYT